MSANPYKSHVVVLPEDDANRDILIGFRLDPSMNFRQVQIEDVAGGWLQVLELFRSEHLPKMRANPLRFLVLLFDFDGHPDKRIELAKSRIPDDLKERVFVLGALANPEGLRASLGPYEAIGMALARDCRDGTDTTWAHALLKHNATEVERLRQHVRPILFP